MVRKAYADKLMSPEQAVSIVSRGATLVHGMGASEPPALLGAIADRIRSGDLKNLYVFSLFPMGTAAKTILAPDIADQVFAYTWFVSSSDRGTVKCGLCSFVPNNFHEVPRLCSEFMNIDVTVTTVSPMDRAGYFTFGTVNDYISTAARHCKTLIVEVNEHMPRVFGDSLLHISEVDAVVEHHSPLLELKPAEPTEEDKIVARQVAELVPDGATIQLGIGGIPNAVCSFLDDRRDLGIHSELFCPGMMDLIRKGIVTGARKNLHPRKHVFTNALGTREMYDFIHDNPSMETYPVSYINDPGVIARNDRFISINATIEVDLLGQCNSEYLGDMQFSGTGGQLDFVRGAFNSKGGKSIIAFRSTAKNGQVSRIVPSLESGAVVTVPRMDTQYLATEYGIVQVKGKSTRDRAFEIIKIAHPKFRDGLLREAEERRIV
ncbi:MAG: acetyl-CoA hydrolase/transferase family protein [Deltaproteobacteria bacterium]|nr:acetyl-CoA hydrolase/transferase family protein [Deltaproteobacteria bacterium]